MTTTIDTPAIGVTPQEVYNLAIEIMDFYDANFENDGPRDWNGIFAKEEEYWERVYALNDRAGKGLQVGKILSFPMGDGAAVYLVQDVRPRSVQVALVCLGDVYQCPFVSQKSTFPRNIAEPRASQYDSGLFGRRTPPIKLKRDIATELR